MTSERKAAEALEQQVQQGYEQRDAKPSFIIISLAIIIGGTLLVGVFSAITQAFFHKTTDLGETTSTLSPSRVIPPTPRIEVHPGETLPEMRTRIERKLSSYGSDGQGHIHIPVSRAIDLTLGRLPVRPGSPPGATEPEGGGRQFAGSLSSIPGGHDRLQNPQDTEAADGK